jgi:hypothetical protein
LNIRAFPLDPSNNKSGSHGCGLSLIVRLVLYKNASNPAGMLPPPFTVAVHSKEQMGLPESNVTRVLFTPVPEREPLGTLLLLKFNTCLE